MVQKQEENECGFFFQEIIRHEIRLQEKRKISEIVLLIGAIFHRVKKWESEMHHCESESSFNKQTTWLQMKQICPMDLLQKKLKSLKVC